LINALLVINKCQILNNLTGLKLENLNNNSNFGSLILNNTISNNMDNGIVIKNIEYPCNKILALENKIIENFSYGISLINGASPNKEIKTNNLDASKKEDPFIYFINCDINNNKRGGIYFNNNTALNIDNCIIQNNKNYSIEIPVETNKTLLKLINYKNNKISPLINGSIGGQWGVISNQINFCSNESCYIL